MKLEPNNASGNYARMIAANVELFNKTPNDEAARNETFRFRTFRKIFELPILEGVIIYGLAHYKTRGQFKGEMDSNFWFARLQNRDGQQLLIIEERREGLWQVQEIIPLKSIESIKTDLVPTDKSKFYLLLTVPSIDEIKTPRTIQPRQTTVA